MYCQLEKSKYRKISTHQKSVSLTGQARQGRPSHNNFVVMPTRQSEPGCNVSPGSAVIQRHTIIDYTNVNPFTGEIQLNSVIQDAVHWRVNFQQEELDIAAVFGRGGNICHHHAPYNRIKNAIVDNILRWHTVGQAIQSLNHAIGQLNQVANWNDSIPDVVFNEFYLMMSQEFDDAIANIANDPRNLFYAPLNNGDGGGRDLDWPVDQARNNLAQNHYMFLYSQILGANHML